MPKPGSRPIAQPVVVNQGPPVLGWIVLLAIIAVSVWLWRLNAINIENNQHDQQQQVVDDKKPTPAPAPDRTELKECVLLVIADKKSVNEDLDYSITLQDDKFWRETAPAIVKDVEFLDDDDEPAKVVLAAAKASAPLVALFNVATKKFVWTIPFPKGGTSEIERKLK